MIKCQPFRNPLCLALDVDSDSEALSISKELEEIIGGIKIGPRLVHRYGQALVKELAQICPVFIDCKFFDIPSTMVAAVRASFEAGASFVTVHALAGKEALSELSHLEKELNLIRPFRILAVTILTSWNESSFPKNFRALSVPDHVRELAELVVASGLHGIVCSPEEIDYIKDLNLFLLTPGIRMPQNEIGDQKRVLGPFEAIQRGSSALVVGRPILQAQNRRQAAAEFLAEIHK